MKEYDSWCIVWCNKNSTVPVMTSNIATKEIADTMAQIMETEQGHKVLGVCSDKQLIEWLKK